MPWSRTKAIDSFSPLMQPDHTNSDQQQFLRVRALFDQAIQLPEDQRADFVRTHAVSPEECEQALKLLACEQLPFLHTMQGLAAGPHTSPEGAHRTGQIGRYQLLERLGAGGMGEVYRARVTSGPEHQVALKIMRPGVFTTNDMARFRSEQQFLAKLKHPGIAHFIESGADDQGNAYVAMELVDGLFLRDYALRHQLNCRERVALFRQLLAAVAYAHSQLIIHRDIKAANVLVTADGVVKLLDFGIAKLLQDQRALTGTLDRVFTPTAAAPEQIRGERCDVTTDVYALGTLLYEFLAGRPMFDIEGLTPGAFESLILSVPPPPMQSRLDAIYGVSRVPMDLERIVAKAIRKEPEGRYRSIEQFDADLERFLNDQAVSVSGNGWLYRARKLVARHRAATLFALLTLVSLGTGTAIVFSQLRATKAEAARANLALDTIKLAYFGMDGAGSQRRAAQNIKQMSEDLIPKLRVSTSEALELAPILLEVQLSLGETDAASDLYQAIPLEQREASPRLCLLGARLDVEQGLLDTAAVKLDRCPARDDGEARVRDLAYARLAQRNADFALASMRYEAIRRYTNVGSPDWIYCLEQQLDSLLRSARREEAAAVLASAEKAVAAIAGANSSARARLLIARVKFLVSIGKNDDIRAEVPGIVAELLELHGDRSIEAAFAEAHLATMLLDAYLADLGLPLLQGSAETLEQRLGPTHPDVLDLKSELLIERGLWKRPRDIVPEDFEALLIQADQPQTRILREKTLVNYAYWLTTVAQPHSALSILRQIDPMARDRLDPKSRFRYELAAWDVYNHNRCPTAVNYQHWQDWVGVIPWDLCTTSTRIDNQCIQIQRLLCHSGFNVGIPDPQLGMRTTPTRGHDHDKTFVQFNVMQIPSRDQP